MTHISNPSTLNLLSNFQYTIPNQSTNQPTNLWVNLCWPHFNRMFGASNPRNKTTCGAWSGRRACASPLHNFRHVDDVTFTISRPEVGDGAKPDAPTSDRQKQNKTTCIPLSVRHACASPLNEPIRNELFAQVWNLLVKVSRLMISQPFALVFDSHSTGERANSCKLIIRGIKPSGQH